MKVAFQTIIWGPFIPDLEEALDVIAAAGYQGVEFAQRPDRLGLGADPNIQDLLRLLAERGLELVGLVGGSLKERMDFCGARRGPFYLYIEDWDDAFASKAVAQGFTLALHPHVFKRFGKLIEAKRLLDSHPELQWLPDTAHLKLAGDDPIQAIALARDRLAAVHFKDWSPAYGTSSYRYSRGFTELGRGIVPLGEILAYLRSFDYTGWLVVEQDSTRDDPQSSARKCAQWLAERDVVLRDRQPPIAGFQIPNISAKIRSGNDTAELRFTRAIMHAGSQEIQQCYQSIAAAFMEAIPCHLVTLWTFDSVRDTISLLANEPALPLRSTIDRELKAAGTLMEVAIERHAVTHFDLAEPNPGAVYGRTEARIQWPYIDMAHWKRMVVIPISISSNLNHVRLTVNLFPKDGKLPFTDEELYLFGMDVARAADFALDDLCSSAAAEANFFAGQKKDSKGFLEDVAYRIRKAVRCEGVSIFLVNPATDRLELWGTTGIEWHVPENDRFYRKGEGCTGDVWRTNEILTTLDANAHSAWKRKSSDTAASPDQDGCLFIPFTRFRGKVVGVVRCRNKIHDQGSPFPIFTDDDVAIIDSIGQAAIPHLEILLGEEQRSKALSRLTHELHNPLVAIQGAIDLMDMDFEDRNMKPASFFTEDYPGDVWSYCELMCRLLDNANLSGATPAPLRVKATHTFLMADVIAPAVRQVRLFLSQRNFPADGISYGRFEQIPRLWIDKSYFQQVIFNLLSNAIKFAVADPVKFRVSIEGVREGDDYLVIVQDWGRGISEGIREAIFEEGVRGADAFANYVAGQGIGLSVIRRIIEAHGGSVNVTKLSRPTEFTIRLPESLARKPPK